MTNVPAAFECDSCGAHMSGYSRKELLEDGWRWHKIKAGEFAMCSECEREYDLRRRARAAVARAAA